jgi:octaprenyl-diphosphate synthase
MTATAQKIALSAPSPLEELSKLLQDDMAQVNRLILDNMVSEIALIPQLAGYLIAAGGKRIRPLLTLACTRLFDQKTDRAFRLAASVEFIHTATLLHDDVVDESTQRRGQSAANVIFGNQASVLVGDFLFSRAFQLMVQDGSLEVLRILSDASAVIAEGEVLQLAIQNDLDTTLDQYERVIASKTARLFAAACEIGPVVSGMGAQEVNALREYGHALGMAFQIADDVLDYQADPQELGKSVGDDFKEGKMTAPVIFALEAAPPDEKAFWIRTFEKKDASAEDLATAQSLIRRHQADQKAQNLALNYAARAQKCLEGLPSGNVAACLFQLPDFAVNRTA